MNLSCNQNFSKLERNSKAKIEVDCLEQATKDSDIWIVDHGEPCFKLSEDEMDNLEPDTILYHVSGSLAGCML